MATVIAGAVRALFVASTLIFDITQNGSRGKREVLRNIYLRSDKYAKKRFSRWKRWALRLMLIDMDLLMQVSDIINDWNDMELLKWNENLLGSFDAIAVAGSVLASVDITALSLDSVSDLHWTTRAAFSVSLLSSVLSVVFGVRTQRQLYLIGGPTKLRRWFSNGELQKPFQSSISAIRVLQLPVELLTVSWATFIAGLILYMSFMWRLHSDPGGVDYRNILICILLVLLILVGYYELLRAIKDVEQGKAFGSKAEPPANGNSDSKAKPFGLPLDKGADVNAQGGYYGNALQAASAKGCWPIVKRLLDKDADVNAQGGYYGNALQAASAGDFEQEVVPIVELLLDKDADVNAQGGYYGNALQAASARGHESIVKRLLDKNADVNAQGGYYGNALQAASANGYEPIVELLLYKGAGANVHGSSGSSWV